MPIETIVPDATTTPNPAWTGGLPHLQLDASDSNLLGCSTTGESFIVSFGNLTSTIGSINSIVFGVQGLVETLRGVDAVCSFTILDSSDSTLYAAEQKTFNDTTIPTIQTGTTRTTSNGSAAWTESDVNGLRMKVKFDSITNAGGDLKLNFLKIDVDYNEPVVVTPTYDSTIGRIVMSGGNSIIDNGTIIID